MRKKKSGGDRLGKLVERTKPEAAERAPNSKTRKKPAEQFGRRVSAKATAKSPSLSNEERMLRAILERD